MARKKNYELSPSRRQQARTATETDNSNAFSRAIEQISSTNDARIDMVDLLGPTARFAHTRRTIDLNEWLGCGIDDWVWSVLVCFRGVLLSGTRETSTVGQYSQDISFFFQFLTKGRKVPRIAKPMQLLPEHIEAFVGWLKARGSRDGLSDETVRTYYKNVKSTLVQMFDMGLIPGEPSRFFTRKAIPHTTADSQQTSLSEAEQVRMANAIKTDLTAVHHGRLLLGFGTIQALRLLLVAHRQGRSPTPILELRRDTLAPGLIPGTIRVRTVKVRGRKVKSNIGRDASKKKMRSSKGEDEITGTVVFDMAEGAVLQQAISDTEEFIKGAPINLKNRIWLYRTSANQGSRVTCLSIITLQNAINQLVERHKLLGDDGEPMRINLSRTRKSYFDRALRATDGDLAKTANLMGNTERVAASNYPSMNQERQAEAAGFMNEDYITMMRDSASNSNQSRAALKVINIKPIPIGDDASPVESFDRTPVAGCKDTLNGKFAYHDGHTHCDRYIMCLFCSSFAIVGTVDELWRLFSFQSFAVEECKQLDAVLGMERTQNDKLEELRERYRIGIPYIDQFTKKQFPASVVKAARAKTEERLHPFWIHQMDLSRRARSRMVARG